MTDPTKPELAAQLAGLLTMQDIARRFGVGLSTVNMWRTRGLLPDPVVDVAGRPLFAPADVEAWGRRTARLPGEPGHIYDHLGYDVTEDYERKQ